MMIINIIFSYSLRPRVLIVLEVRSNMPTELVCRLIQRDLINHIAHGTLPNFLFLIKVIFLCHLCSIKLPRKVILESQQQSLWGRKEDARHCSEGPLKEKREYDVYDIAVDEDSTEEEQEVFVFKEDHLLLAEVDDKKAEALVASECEVGTGEGPEERGAQELSND